jgi:hypothetical protein
MRKRCSPWFSGCGSLSPRLAVVVPIALALLALPRVAAALSPQASSGSAAGETAAPIATNATCKEEFIATKRLLQASQSDLQAALQGPAEARCRAMRQNYAAMIAARAVFARCDTGEARAQHTAQLDASISRFKQRIPPECGLH